MQSQVVSGTPPPPPPIFSLSALSPTKRLLPSIFPSLFPLVFSFALLVCLFICITSLHFYLPPSTPSFLSLSLSRGISLYFSERVSWQKLPLLGSGRGRCTVQAVIDHTDVQGWDSVKWNDGILNFLWLDSCVFIQLPHGTLELKCNLSIQTSQTPNVLTM